MKDNITLYDDFSRYSRSKESFDSRVPSWVTLEGLSKVLSEKSLRKLYRN